jgi:hypothetical protein
VSGKPIDQLTASNSRQLSVDADIFVPRNAVLCFKQPSDTLSSSNESSTKGLSAPDLSAALAIDSTKLPFIQPKDEVDEALMQTEASIALLKGYLDTLEKENERHSIFAKIAKKRKKYTEKCEYLIQQAEFLLKEIDISLQDSLFQEAIKETENAKADFETKKAEFKRYIQVLLNPDAHTNRAKPTDYFSTSMENIYLYNLFLENKIIILENILNSVDSYL